jgi:hypothetical protein
MMPVFSGPPQVCAVEARGGDAVGADDGAVEVQVCQPGRLRAFQRGLKVRCPGRRHGLSLVEVAVCGGNRHPIVAGELSQAGAVEEPAQDEHGLFEAAQRTPPLAGSGRDPVIAQQPGVRRR